MFVLALGVRGAIKQKCDCVTEPICEVESVAQGIASFLPPDGKEIGSLLMFGMGHGSKGSNPQKRRRTDEDCEEEEPEDDGDTECTSDGKVAKANFRSLIKEQLQLSFTDYLKAKNTPVANSTERRPGVTEREDATTEGTQVGSELVDMDDSDDDDYILGIRG